MKQGVELRQQIVRDWPDRTDQIHRLAVELNELATLYQATGQVKPAIETELRSLTLWEQLDRRFSKNELFQTNLYLACDNMSRLLNMQDETKEALGWSECARVVLEQLVAQFPKKAAYKIDLSRCYSFLGRLHQHEENFADALTFFQQAVDVLESCSKLDAEDRYQLAVNLSRCLSLVGASSETGLPEDDAKLAPGERLRRKLYGNRAVAILGQAVKEGLTNPERIQSDPELNPLRGRPDFQKLLDELARTMKEKK